MILEKFSLFYKRGFFRLIPADKTHFVTVLFKILSQNSLSKVGETCISISVGVRKIKGKVSRGTGVRDQAIH